jgi:glycosyltransferase involved in cell wall biosynthesis
MNPDFPLISIAICTYNGEKYIEEQLDSIVNQSYPNLEIIVLDDCSTDNTIAIIKAKYNYPNLKLYANNCNLGFIKNFEKILPLCNGEYIALADQDDIWHLDKILLQSKLIQNNLLVYADSELVDEDGISLNTKVSDRFNFVRGNPNLAFIISNCISGHNILFKKDLLAYALPLPLNVFHDIWLVFVASTIGTIDFVDLPLVKYRQHKKSVTKFHSPKIYKALKYRNKYKVIKLIETQLQAYSNFVHPSFDNVALIKEFSDLYHRKWLSRFDFRLFILLIKNLNQIYAIPKISNFKKVFRALRECNHLFVPKKVMNFYNKKY